ncbi:MAG: DUF1080 domain-containing protein [Cyclobacteriaceae bacterium]
MTRILILGFLILSACQTKTDSTNPSSETQNAEGWQSLFDGQTMNGWRPFKNADINSWEVVDGTLHCKPFQEGAENKRGDLISEGQYENFELKLEWKISSQGNSGIMFRVSEEYDQPYATGPEYQVLDDANYPGEVKAENQSGSNYDLHAATGKTLKPVGEWNEARIFVKGDHVEHWLNGTKVTEYELNSEDWKQRVANSKWKDFPGYGMVRKGHIDLQDHGNEVWYRNIMIREL